MKGVVGRGLGGFGGLEAGKFSCDNDVIAFCLGIWCLGPGGRGEWVVISVGESGV